MDLLAKTGETEEAGFAEIVRLIAAARQRALQSVNTTLIDLYWQVGEYISRKIEASEWGVASCRNWLNTSPGRSQGNAASRAITCSE